MTEQRLRVLLIGESSDRREFVRGLLDEAVVTVVAEAQLVPEVVGLAQEVLPDVLIVVLDKPADKALGVIELLAVATHETPILALSSAADSTELRRAVVAGARDYLDLGASEDALTGAIVQLAAQRQKRAELSESLAERDRVGQLIVICGGKGGIGRTTLATQLGIALSTSTREGGPGLRVVLVDLDLEFGDVTLFLDLVPDHSITELGGALGRLDFDLLRSYLCAHTSGLQVLASPGHPGNDAGAGLAAAVGTVLSMLTRMFDIVLVDTPRQMTGHVRVALDAAHTVLLVSSNHVASLKNTRLALTMMRDLDYPSGKVKVVMNEVHEGIGVTLDEAVDALGYPVSWRIPHDGRPGGLGKWGKSFMRGPQRSRIEESVDGLARQLRQVSFVLEVPDRVGGSKL